MLLRKKKEEKKKKKNGRSPVHDPMVYVSSRSALQNTRTEFSYVFSW